MEPALMAAEVAAALDNGRSMQARQLRHEGKHGRRPLLVGRANQHGVELTRPHQVVYFVGVANGENEVLQADAGRVEQSRGPPPQGRAPCTVLDGRLRVGSEWDEKRYADELAVRQ